MRTMGMHRDKRGSNIATSLAMAMRPRSHGARAAALQCENDARDCPTAAALGATGRGGPEAHLPDGLAADAGTSTAKPVAPSATVNQGGGCARDSGRALTSSP